MGAMKNYGKLAGRRQVMRTVFAVVMVGTACFAFACGGGTDKTATLSGTDGHEIAKGEVSAMLARASELAEIKVLLPGYMPPESYVRSIAVSGTSGGSDGIHVVVDIHVPTGEYFLAEYKGSYTGGKSSTIEGTPEVDPSWKAVPGLSSPNKSVYIIPNGAASNANAQKATGYAIVGNRRSYTIEASAPHAYDAAVVDLPKIVRSLPMD
jgi:hypothetical protein